MEAGSFGTVPYIPDFNNLAFDALVCFIVSMLLAVLVNAEAQAWMGTLLGDARPGAKDRLHFNVFFHLSLPGTLCYFLAGFGWPKPIDLDPAKFSHPRLFTVIARFSGVIANLLLANIAASIVFVFRFVEMDPLVFLMVVGVNLTTAVYHLIPIPPLAAGSLITIWFSTPSPQTKRLWYYSGSALLLALFAFERFSGRGLISPYLNPVVVKILNFLTS